MRNRYGSSVLGTDFWPRDLITDEIVELLSAGDSVGLFGLRRIGKSSILHAVQAKLKFAKREAVFVDLQGAGNVVAFFESLICALTKSESGRQITGQLTSSKALSTVVTSFFGRLAGLGSQGDSSPQAGDLNAYLRTVGELIANAVESLDEDKRPILLLDELPYLLDHAIKAGAQSAEIEALLAMLRMWRGKGLAMLLSGSIGLYGWTRRKNIDAVHLNDLVPVDLPPLSKQEATEFLGKLVQAEALDWWTDATTEAVIEHTSALYPSFLQFAVQKLKRTKDGSPQSVARTIATEVRPKHDMPFYRQFDDRIQEYGDLREVALTVIGRACKSDLSYDEFRKLLDPLAPVHRSDLESMLREDGFLILSPVDIVRPASPLVCVWAETRGR